MAPQPGNEDLPQTDISVKITLPKKALEQLAALKHPRGDDLHRLIEDAISHEAFMWRQVNEGARILIKDKYGAIREMSLLRPDE
jgi:hypothetical protein